MITTWQCDMCKKEREDKDIKVLTYSLKNLMGALRNLKYCRDNNQCFAKATAKAKTGEV